MYLPRSFAETDVGALHAFMGAHPFAALVTSEGGLFATHLPLVLRADVGPYGVLEGHVARANEHHKRGSGPIEGLVMFIGVHAHVTPTWYPSKAVDGRTVPTWNYVAVHAYGRVRFLDDEAFLRAHLARLSERHEPMRDSAWAPSDAPADYVAQQLRAIVGVEIEITRLEGKWKMSQNRSDEDARGVVDGLHSTGDAMDAAVAELVGRRLERS